MCIYFTIHWLNMWKQSLGINQMCTFSQCMHKIIRESYNVMSRAIDIVPPFCLLTKALTLDLWCVTVPGSNGSGTSEDLFWKLDALQTFIRDLHWPEEEFAKHLENRMKLMSSDMIESCVKRYMHVEFENKKCKDVISTVIIWTVGVK